MGGDLSPSIKVTIVREEDLAAYLAGDVEVEEILAEVSEAYTDNVEVAEVGEALLDEEEVVGALEESEDAAEGLEESEEPEEPEEE
jgi:hypothetical protein